MKDKRKYLKIESILGFLLEIVNIIHVLSIKSSKEEIISTIFMMLISFVFCILLYKESKKELIDIKNNKALVIIATIWFIFESIVPGIIGLLFLNSLKEKKNIENDLPIVNNDNNLKIKIKSSIVIVLFIFFMFIFSKFKISNKVPDYIIYIIIFITTISMFFNELKSNFKVFINNKKIYSKFIIKRYLKMFLGMLIISIPIVLINNGKSSVNQQLLGEMFEKKTLFIAILTTLYAPLIEETVFRLCFSKLIKNKYLFIIISGIVFGYMHLIGNYSNYKEFLYIFQYSFLGICLAKAYKDSNNIFVSISMHFIQNTLSVILMLILMLTGN